MSSSMCLKSRTDSTLSSSRLALQPELLYSTKLSEMTGLSVSILHWGRKPNPYIKTLTTGTHKIRKGYAIARYALETKKKIITNVTSYSPLVRRVSRGGGREGIELAVLEEDPEAQIINFVPSERPSLIVEPTNSSYPNSEQTVEIGVDMNKYWGLEAMRDSIIDLLTTPSADRNVKKLRKILDEKEIDFLDPKTYFDATNLTSELLDEDVYSYDPALLEKLRQNKFHFGSIGTGERGFYDVLQLMGNVNLCFIVPQGSYLDPAYMHRYSRNHEHEGLEPFNLTESHKRIRDVAQNNKRVCFRFTAKQESLDALRVFGNVLAQEYPEYAAGMDGCAALSVLRNRHDPNHRDYFRRFGGKSYVRVPGIYQWDGSHFAYDAIGRDSGLFIEE
jgi:hypothetical protein